MWRHTPIISNEHKQCFLTAYEIKPNRPQGFGSTTSKFGIMLEHCDFVVTTRYNLST